MLSKIILDSQNLSHNISYLLEQAEGREVCLMIKADAYGHGMEEIIALVDGKITTFGVSNLQEALRAREYTSHKVIIFGDCEDPLLCMMNNISMSLLSVDQLKKILKIAKKENLKPKLHLNVNTGMNRFGIQSKKDLKKIIELCVKNNIELEGIFTHFSSLTTDEEYSQMQENKFAQFADMLPQEWNTIVHVGGGNSLFENLDCDMIRVGLLAYGYGNEHVLPVMKIKSKVSDLQLVHKGEHVGYLCGFTAEEDMIVATIPLGYADGLPRKLSNILKVKIRGRLCQSTGNICMDSFMVDVSNVNVKVGDEVEILNNANDISEILGTTAYEVCTNFIKLRGERIIK
jgi:alanine racemase